MIKPEHHHVATMAAHAASTICTSMDGTKRYTPAEAAAAVTDAYRAALAELAKPIPPEQPKE